MRHQARDVVACLCLDMCIHLGRLGIGRAGEREVLPDHHAQLVAQVVEVVRLEHAAAPHPQQVDVGCLRLLDALAVALAGDASGKAVIRDPVGAADPDGLAVDDELETGPDVVLASVEVNGPEADGPLPGVQERVPVP